MKSLWSLFTVVCVVMPISGALASAKFSGVGIGGYAFSVFLGLGLGVGCAWVMEKIGKLVYDRLKHSAGPIQERYFRALYFAAMVWIVFALFLGEWVTSPLLHLFKP